MGREWVLLIAWFTSLAVNTAQAAGLSVTEGFINAPVGEVWRLFTTSEGLRSAGRAQAEIDLRIGGTIRTHEDPNGVLGDPNTTVKEILAYEPERMLAMRIKRAPDNFPFKDAMLRSWTVVHLLPAGSMTQVRIVGLGYGDDAESRAMREFFEKASRISIDRMAKPFWPKCARCAAE